MFRAFSSSLLWMGGYVRRSASKICSWSSWFRSPGKISRLPLRSRSIRRRTHGRGATISSLALDCMCVRTLVVAICIVFQIPPMFHSAIPREHWLLQVCSLWGEGAFARVRRASTSTLSCFNIFNMRARGLPSTTKTTPSVTVSIQVRRRNLITLYSIES